MDFFRSEWDEDRRKLYSRASVLAGITVWYNMAEGLVSVFFGAMMKRSPSSASAWTPLSSSIRCRHMAYDQASPAGRDENPTDLNSRHSGSPASPLSPHGGLTGVALLNLFGDTGPRRRSGNRRVRGFDRLHGVPYPCEGEGREIVAFGGDPCGCSVHKSLCAAFRRTSHCEHRV